jgi:hypothetical protein
MGRVRAIVSLAAVWASFGLALSGCSYNPPPRAVQPEEIKLSGKDQLKQKLSAVAESGAGGSGLAGIQDAIAGLESSDKALADQLMKDYAQLQSLQEPAQIKAVAKRMVDKL